MPKQSAYPDSAAPCTCRMQANMFCWHGPLGAGRKWRGQQGAGAAASAQLRAVPAPHRPQGFMARSRAAGECA